MTAPAVPSLPSFEDRLDELARGAIAAGGDQSAISDKLARTHHYLRAFPGVARQADAAVNAGADISAMSDTLWHHVTAIENAHSGPEPSSGHGTSRSWGGPEEQPKIQGPLVRRFLGTTPETPSAAEVAGPFIATMQGFPGAERAAAGLRSAVRREPYEESLSTIRGSASTVPPLTRAALRVAGAVPAATLTGGMGPVAAGAALGGATEALSADEESPLKRAGKTTGGVVLGGLLGRGADMVGNIAQRSGLTDKLGAGLRAVGNRLSVPVAADVGEAVGTRGAANSVLADRQSILDQLSGSEHTAARQMLDHVAKYKAQAGKLYDVAREDTQAIEDPRVQSLLDNPLVAKAYEWGKANYVARGNELPTRTTLAEGAEMETGVGREAERARTPGGRLASLRSASDAELAGEYKALLDANAQEVVAPTVTGASPTDYGDLHVGMKQGAVRAAGRVAARNKSLRKLTEEFERRGIEPGDAYQMADAVSFDFGANLPATYPAGAETTRELPNPEVLALTKRGLSQIARGYNSTSPITQEQAVTALPLVDQLRAALHEASPAWKDADNFYARAKTFEDVFQRAYGAQRNVTASGLMPGKGKSPEAIDALVAGRAGKPTGIAAASGQRAGAAARIAESVRAQPIGPTSGDLVGSGLLDPFNPNAANARRMAFETPEASAQFSSSLAGLAATGQRDAARFGQQSKPWKPWTWAPSRNPLETSGGMDLRSQLATRLADPRQAAAIRDQITRSGRGKELLGFLYRLGLAGGSAALP